MFFFVLYMVNDSFCHTFRAHFKTSSKVPERGRKIGKLIPHTILILWSQVNLSKLFLDMVSRFLQVTLPRVLRNSFRREQKCACGIA